MLNPLIPTVMMKRMIYLMALGLTMAASTMAMDRREARAEARYLTDKMAYELGLSPRRSEEHTSELQSRQYLVCRLLLEKKTHTSLCPMRMFLPSFSAFIPSA